MSDYNWVRDCADCDTYTVFQSLYEIADKDVRTANDVFDLHTLRFNISKGANRNHNRHEFTVVRLENESVIASSSFMKRKSDIVVSLSLAADKPAERKLVTVNWNTEKCACVYKLDTDILDLWQIVQRCLEPVFFWREQT